MEDIRQWAILDSGATSNFILAEAPLDDERPAANPITAKLPDGRRVTSTHDGRIRLHQLPEKARYAHKMPGLASHSLISVIKLCDAGCEVKFTKIGCEISYRGRTIICGRKCKRSGLWMIPIDSEQSGTSERVTRRPEPTQRINAMQTSNVNRYVQLLEDVAEQMNTLIGSNAAGQTTNGIEEIAATLATTSEHLANMQQLRDSMSKAELALFYHQCLGSPAITTLLKAIKNKQLESFPGLTYELISRHLPQTTADVKGRMSRIRQGVQSTRNQIEQIREARAEVDDMNPDEEICATREIYCYAVWADRQTGKMYTDQTGTFPVRSFSNMKLLFVAYIYDINAILAIPLKSRTDEAMVDAFRQVISKLEECNSKPKVNVMDNECSRAVEQYIKKSANMDIELCPPKNHRLNGLGERAVRTFKDHFISTLATVDPTCPIQLWNEFVEQANDTLNLLRTSRRNPSISAYQELNGKFDYNKTPLVPV